jgi:hypothetical protein
MLSASEARYLLTLLSKGRSLVMIDARYARSPFPYDKKFFDRLRKDQVPRFLRCLTDPQKLPQRVFDLDQLWTLQDRVDVAKVEAIRSSPTIKPPVVVKTRDHFYIVDGLHRMSVDWLDHREEVVAHYCDLSDKTNDVEPVPGAGKFDKTEERYAP